MPRWFLWAALALISWGIWAIISKIIGDALSAAHSQALSTLGLLPVMLLLGLSKTFSLPWEPRLLDTGNPGGQALPSSGPSDTSTDEVQRPLSAARVAAANGIGPDGPSHNGSGDARGLAFALTAGILSCLGNVAYYHALNLGGKAATVIPLTALYPLVTVLLALLLLRERLNAAQTSGIALSLGAIYLFNIQNDSGFLSGGLVFALLPIVLWGVAGLLQKVASNFLSGEAATFWFLSAFVPVALIILISQPWPERVSSTTWLLVAALGLFFSLGNYALLAAFARQGKASLITPLTALYPVVSVPVAVLFLGEKVGPREWTGIGLALVSVAALSYEKTAKTVEAGSLKL